MGDQDRHRTGEDEHPVWDLAIVGAGPAGASAALGALHARPDLSVLLLDRADFPRDKACGDGIAPHVLDLLAEVGVTGGMDDQVPVTRLRLERGDVTAARTMRRPAWVVPREVFDARLVAAATAAGAELRRHRVRDLTLDDDRVHLDGGISARVVVGADGAHSVVRATLELGSGRTAFALRGYAPTPAQRRGEQVIVFGTSRQPSYAWSFDRGDGLANVGYGEVLTTTRPAPSRSLLLSRLEELLPGSTAGGTGWRGHHLPLSGRRWSHPDGRVLLAGDAAGLINPLTGEGIYYAVATGLAAGRAAAAAAHPTAHRLAHRPAPWAGPGAAYRRSVTRLLARHLRHTALTARLATAERVLEPGLLAAAADQRVFDDLVELGLGRGRVTPAVVRGLAGAAVRRIVHAPVARG
jgi:geranylgeranyl reductase family protein